MDCRINIPEVEKRTPAMLRHAEIDYLTTVCERWEEALSQNDLDALVAAYTPDGSIESPLIPHLMGSKRGVCRGRDELRSFYAALTKRKPQRSFHRKPFFVDGETVMWECPRESPEGDQMDVVEVMEIKDGLIFRHRVYWGWFGAGVMMRDEYR
jgi:ketosteroid isomerase-like protein